MALDGVEYNKHEAAIKRSEFHEFESFVLDFFYSFS